jgi:hypothetical protein
MLVVLQALSVLGMVAATFYVYQAFGPRRASLLYTREEKEDWDRLVQGGISNWLTGANIFSTVTSLATVYIFFIGNTRSFGWWILVSVLTIWLGGFVTNYVTRRLLLQPRVVGLLQNLNQSGALLPAIFREMGASANAAIAAKAISIASIAAILWLEFSVFTDLSMGIAGITGRLSAGIILFVCAFAVILFVLRYGLRGYILADLFHSPIVVIGTFTYSWVQLSHFPEFLPGMA